MDPLSVAVAVVSLLTAVGTTVTSTTNFVEKFREAPGELITLSTQLAELQSTLNIIDGEQDFSQNLPSSLRQQIAGVVNNCEEAVNELHTVVSGHSQIQSSFQLRAKWALTGKSKVTALGQQLDAHTRSLVIALEVHRLSLTGAIKNETSTFGQRTSEIRSIRRDTRSILRLLGKRKKGISAPRRPGQDGLETDIGDLRALIAEDRQGIGRSAPALLGYLDSASSYAESVAHTEDSSAFSTGGTIRNPAGPSRTSHSVQDSQANESEAPESVALASGDGTVTVPTVSVSGSSSDSRAQRDTTTSLSRPSQQFSSASKPALIRDTQSHSGYSSQRYQSTPFEQEYSSFADHDEPETTKVKYLRTSDGRNYVEVEDTPSMFGPRTAFVTFHMPEAMGRTTGPALPPDIPSGLSAGGAFLPSRMANHQGPDLGNITVSQWAMVDIENAELSLCGNWASWQQLELSDDGTEYSMSLKVLDLVTGDMFPGCAMIPADGTVGTGMLANAFSPDSKIIIAFYDGVLITYKFYSNFLQTPQSHRRGAWISVGASELTSQSLLLDTSTNWKWRLFLSRTGRTLAVFESAISISLYDMIDPEEAPPGLGICDWKKKRSPADGQTSSAYWDAAFSPSDENILAVYEEVDFQNALTGESRLGIRRNGQISLWDCDSGTVIRTIKLPTNISFDRSARPFGRMGDVWVLTRYFFPDAKDKNKGSNTCVVDALDLMTGRIIQQWSFPSDDFEWNSMGAWGGAFYYPWVRIDPDHGRMAVSWHDIKVSELWDLNLGRRLKTINKTIFRSGPTDFHHVLVEGIEPGKLQVWKVEGLD